MTRWPERRVRDGEARSDWPFQAAILLALLSGFAEWFMAEPTLEETSEPIARTQPFREEGPVALGDDRGSGVPRSTAG